MQNMHDKPGNFQDPDIFAFDSGGRWKYPARTWASSTSRGTGLDTKRSPPRMRTSSRWRDELEQWIRKRTVAPCTCILGVVEQ